MQILREGEDWLVISQGHRFTEGPAVNRAGEVFFTDIPSNRIHKIDAAGVVSVFAEETGGANGLMFGPDDLLYACANRNRQIVAYNSVGEGLVVAEDVPSNDLAITHGGDIYFTDPSNKQVWHLPKGGKARVADTGIGRPNGILLTPDQSLLLVADTAGQFVYSFQIQPDGSLAHKQRFFWLHLADGSTQSGADGMTVDTEGRLYVTTELGLQVCDQAGRVQAILAKPQPAWLANAVFGGANMDELYVTCGDKVYKRLTSARGVRSYDAPVLPPRPRL
jgi:sugar lactone lactonase YvrE